MYCYYYSCRIFTASVMRSLGHTISESEAKEMVNEVDEDGSGEVDRVRLSACPRDDSG